MKNVKMRLIIDVEYIPNDTNERYLRDLLGGLIESAVDRGQLTGESPAEVETWEYKIQRIE